MRPGSRVVRWIGDDCAVVPAGGVAAVSTDVMVDGTHFRLGQATPEDAGWRALAGALSDIAAMGAAPGEAYLSLVLPSALGDEDVVALHRGAEALAAESGVTIAGGDLTRGPALTLAVTVVGWAALRRRRRRPRRRAVGRPRRRHRDARRRGGRPGDPRRRGRAHASWSAATCARARSWLRGGRWPRGGERDARPVRRPGVGRAAARRGERRADRTRRGGAAARPGGRGGGGCAGGRAAELAATGGEDYELCVCVPRSSDVAGLTWIGEVVEGPPEVTMEGRPARR